MSTASTNSRARKHVLANAVLQFVLAAVYAVVVIAVVVAAVMLYFGDSGTGPLAEQAADASQRTGLVFGIVALFVTCSVCCVWTFVNAMGLVGKKRWARATTSAYWFFSVLTVVGIPVSLYGLWSLGQEAVRELFFPDDVSS